jgi:outer membrane protein assembly factor BamD
MRYPFVFLIMMSISIIGLTACSSDNKDGKNQLPTEKSAEQIFNEAGQADKDGDYKKAQNLYAEVERLYPYSDYATKAQIRQAEAAYENMKYDDAIVAIDRFVELHPGHPNVDHAYYIKAMCYYEQITDVARDQSMTEKASESLDTVINRFPESQYARDAKLKRDLVLDHLAGKEMEIGRYYQKKAEYNAAINRFTAVIKNFQTTTHTPEALHRLVETYTIMGLKDEATRAAAVLGHNYPGSQWYEDSYAILDPAQRANLKDTRSWVSRTLSDWSRPD